MSAGLEQFYVEAKSWQSGIGAFVGLVAIILGALYNARLNRQRDARLHSEEVVAVASALYGEIVILRQAVARMANAVANRYVGYGTGRLRDDPFDRHFIEQMALPPLRLYPALAEKVGMLPPQIALEVVRFYARVEEAQAWLPRLQNDAERPFTYSVCYVLDPAIDAITGVLPALKKIEDLAGIAERIDTPDIKEALDAQDFERMRNEQQ